MEDQSSSEITPEPGQYRVVTKRRLALIVVTVTVLAAIPTFLFRMWAHTYLEQIAKIGQTHPGIALEQLAFLAETVFGTTTVVLLGMSAFVGWYGFRILRSGHAPPPGAWLLEGSKVAIGAQAERAGKLHMFVCALLATAGVVTFALGHRLAETVPIPSIEQLHRNGGRMNVTSAPIYPRSLRDAGLDCS